MTLTLFSPPMGSLVLRDTGYCDSSERKGLRPNLVVLPSTEDQPGRKAWSWVEVIKPQGASPTDLVMSRESTLHGYPQGSTLT